MKPERIIIILLVQVTNNQYTQILPGEIFRFLLFPTAAAEQTFNLRTFNSCFLLLLKQAEPKRPEASPTVVFIFLMFSVGKSEVKIHIAKR